MVGGGGGGACGKHSTGGNWTKEESYFHINVLEMAAAFFAVKSYSASFSETSIHLRVDITASLAWINNQNAPNETVHLPRSFVLKSKYRSTHRI